MIAICLGTHRASAVDESPASISLRFLACDVTKEKPRLFLETEEARSIEFDLPSNSLSQPIEVTSRAVSIKADDNRTLLANLVLPDQGQAFAVLLMSKKPSGFSPIVIRLDDDSFQAGEYLFVNCLQDPVAIELGEIEFMVEAAGFVKSSPTAPKGRPFCTVSMRTRGESGEKLFASTRWQIPNLQRSFITITSRSSGRVTYRAIDVPLANHP